MSAVSVTSTPTSPVALHNRVARIAGISVRAAQRYLYSTPKRVDYRVASAVVLAMRQLAEPIPPNLQWAVEFVDANANEGGAK